MGFTYKGITVGVYSGMKGQEIDEKIQMIPESNHYIRYTSKE